MRVAFCGGGTGGHVYPALAVAAALRSIAPEDPPRFLYIGVQGRIDRRLVERVGIEFHGVKAGPLRVGSVPGAAVGALKLAAGTGQALSILARFRPDVVFATGGYGSVGAGLAARLERRRLLLFLPDVEAGMAVRSLARIANRIAVTVPPAQEAMPAAKTVLTGYPVRAAFFDAGREAGRRALGLEPDLPTLLVSGASSGASRLNDSVSGWAPEFLKIGQLVHLAGERDEPRLRRSLEALPPDLQARYHLHAYLDDEMPLALAAADLGVMRAGASVLGELPASRLPAILVPGEYEGWDQAPNARYLEAQGAAVMLRQERLHELPAMVMYLINNTGRLEAMRAALAGLARPDAAEKLARLIMEMAGRGQQRSAGE